ncbi:MAG: GC-type dockerin domain-anchored protein [bacterium]
MNRFLIASLVSVAGLAVGVGAGVPGINLYLPLGGDGLSQFMDFNGISKDGGVLVGQSTSANNVNGGPVYLDGGLFVEIGGTISSALNAANADGSLLVGARGTSILNNQGVLHVLATGDNITLADLPGGAVLQSNAFAISDTGSRIVGFVTPLGTSTPARWEYTVGTTPASIAPQTIAMPTGITVTGAFARGISGNGSIIAGFLRRGTSPNSNPAGWVNVNGGAGPSAILPDLSGGTDLGEVYGVSNDGSTIVGWGTDQAGFPAVKWTGGPTAWAPAALALRPGSTRAIAYAVNANGSRIVGESILGTTSEAVIWDGNTVTSLADAIVAAGGFVPAGVLLVSASGISGDGSVIVGEAVIDGLIDSAFVANLPTPNPCPNPSNVSGPGQNTTAIDGELTADDIIVFLNRFFAGDLLSDVSGPGQNTPAHDGEQTAADILVFLNRIFAGC